jgi:hypothetical protein
MPLLVKHHVHPVLQEDTVLEELTSAQMHVQQGRFPQEALLPAHL